MITKPKNIPQNLQSGLVVSLVALPLSFGLALASGVPPMAGIIATVAGAIFFFILGSSRLIIAGPGNGLVVLSLYGVGVLGNGDSFLGYQLLLGAIFTSGLFILLMGIFRFGVLSELFPAAAIRGMLAAIGLIILSRQIHILLGLEPLASGAFQLLAELPHSLNLIWEGQSEAAAYGLGITSLILLFVLPKVNFWAFQKIPAPMWVLAIGIAYTYLAPSFPLWPQLSADKLISLPSEIKEAFVFPSFDAWTNGSFWSISLSLAFIAAVESLLSIKAITKLDPEQKRSNSNKDLRALGLATMASSIIGGLNVVAVIARSSVNLNNGASNAYSNLFHGLFLALFLALFSTQLEHIPLAVLAAILVHTGYKLTAPSQFRAMAEFGRDELILFVFTYLITLSSNLIIGILSGMLLTLVYQLLSLGKGTYFIRSIFRPNVLLFEEQNHKFHLSVKTMSNFLNFLRLKKQLDTIDPHSELILDFSLAHYVDHSVLEHIQQYRIRFEAAGGSLELIGLDDLYPSSSHPLSNRKPRGKKGQAKGKLSRRQKFLRLFAAEHNYHFAPHEVEDHGRFKDFDYFNTKFIHLLRNRIQCRDQSWLWCDIHFEDNDFYGNALRHASMAYIPLKNKTAAFVLDKERLLDRVSHLAGFRDIDFDLHPDFSQRFKLKGDKEKAIRGFFSNALISFLESHKQYHIECNGRGLLIFDKERVATVSETKQMVNFVEQLTEVLNK
ncbi:MAG: SulP family inorganic anion transporter [Bacteroidetes bacterium]|nr:SulP family inorganic anion transporter [Bacteroidota bacterium]